MEIVNFLRSVFKSAGMSFLHILLVRANRTSLVSMGGEKAHFSGEEHMHTERERVDGIHH